MNLSDLAARLQSGQITIAEWESQMREFLRTIYREALVLAAGGEQFVTQSMWGFEGSLLKKQYDYLAGFAVEIMLNPNAWAGRNLLYRMQLYESSAWGALDQFVQRDMEQAGYTEERRKLGKAEHCQPDDKRGTPGCEELADKDWQPMGSLPEIGAATCGVNCRCVKEFRKPGPRGTWTVSGET